MENLEFLKSVLMSEAEYWIAARRQGSKGMFAKDQIVFFSLPPQIRRGLKHDEILLKDVEELSRAHVANVFINEDFPPFQCYINISEMYIGFPVFRNQKKFLIDAVALNSDKIYDYEKLIDS